MKPVRTKADYKAALTRIEQLIAQNPATHFKGSRMYLDNVAADRLIKQYFKK